MNTIGHLALVFALALSPLAAIAGPAEVAELTTIQAAALEELRARHGANSVSLFDLDVSALPQAPVGQVLTIPLRSELFSAQGTKPVLPLEGGRRLWRGRVHGGGFLPDAQSTIILDGSEAVGVVRTRNGKSFQIRPIGGDRSALIEVEWSKARRDDLSPPRSARRRHALRTLRTQRTTSSPVIDILVVHTAAAKRAARNMNALVDLLVADTNLSLEMSGISASVRAIDVMEIGYSETGHTLKAMLAALQTMDDVRQRRDLVGADVVFLLADAPEDEFAGWSVVNKDNYAFAVADQWWAAAYYTFGHEIGHLVGADHDLGCKPDTLDGDAHGYRHPAPQWGWRTMMACPCEEGVTNCGIRVLFWSNPFVGFDGAATGTVEHENIARVWNMYAEWLASLGTRPAGGD